MNLKSKELKAMARTQLSGKFSIYIAAFLLYLLIDFSANSVVTFAFSTSSSLIRLTMGQQIVQVIITFIISLIMTVLQLGFYKMYLDGARNYPVRMGDLFFGFGHHPDRILLMALAEAAILLLPLLPGIIFLYLGFGTSMVIAAGFLLLAGVIIDIYLMLCFGLSMFLMADYEDLGPIQVLKESKKLMRGHKGRLLYINLSFMGLMFLGVISCYIGLLWVSPYIYMTLTNFYRDVTGEIRQAEQ